MAGTTTNYAFPYPTSGDLAKNGATSIQGLADAIDSYISGSSGAGKLFRIWTDSSSSPQTQSGTGWALKPDTQVTFTTGASGMFLAILFVNGSHAAAGEAARARINFTGALTNDSQDVRCVGTVNQTQFMVQPFDGTGNASCTATLAMASTTTGQATISNAQIWIVTFG